MPYQDQTGQLFWPDPEPLSIEYHKARKQLLLWSAVVLVWQIIGIDIEAAKNAGGNVGPVLAAIKRPKDIPLAIACLVIYFLLKVTIELGQCNERRRSMPPSKIDYITAYAVALLALFSVGYFH